MREIKFRAKVNGGYVYSDSYVNLAFYFDATKAYEQEQYTGLKDKNGKEIFEGDILTYHNGYGPKKVVEYNNKQGYYRCNFHKGGGFIDTLDYYMKRECEIIGNIYENPE